MKPSNPKTRSTSSPSTSSKPDKDAALDLKEIRKIIDLMKDNDLTLFHLEKDEFKIKLRRGPDNDPSFSLPSSYPIPPASSPASHGQPNPSHQTPPNPAPNPAPEGEEIPSPMVGTFYRSPDPESPPFIDVGDTISQGQVICIIEAMKVMNEIKAERSGTITAILAEDASPVQFGEALFRIN